MSTAAETKAVAPCWPVEAAYMPQGARPGGVAGGEALGRARQATADDGVAWQHGAYYAPDVVKRSARRGSCSSDRSSAVLARDWKLRALVSISSFACSHESCHVSNRFRQHNKYNTKLNSSARCKLREGSRKRSTISTLRRRSPPGISLVLGSQLKHSCQDTILLFVVTGVTLDTGHSVSSLLS